ncbi:MAG: SSU ribosomal protein S12p (S23e), partial [uncultured Blastococcus sp.]
AHDQPAGPQGPRGQGREDQDSGAEGFAPASRS